MATQLAHVQGIGTRRWDGAEASRLAYAFAKRALDLILSISLLLVLLPLLLLISLAIRLDSPGPIFFMQERVRGNQVGSRSEWGRHTFRFLKFRTMFHNADQQLHQRYMESLINKTVSGPESNGLFKIGADPRITRVGRWLRKTSLDELPQLVNIVLGEMTFVGPRPAIPYEVAQYEGWYLDRLVVKQGLTGLWQVSGRNALTFEQMIELDVAYVKQRSLWLDLRIMAATIPAVLIQRGAC